MPRNDVHTYTVKRELPPKTDGKEPIAIYTLLRDNSTTVCPYKPPFIGQHQVTGQQFPMFQPCCTMCPFASVSEDEAGKKSFHIQCHGNLNSFEITETEDQKRSKLIQM